MHLPVFEHAFLLQSLGWGIANSLWQTGSLWFFYQLVTTIDKKLPSVVKHHLGIALLFTSFSWFICTILANYRLLTNTFGSPEIYLTDAWLLRLQPFNYALPYLSIVYLLLFCLHAAGYINNLSANRFLQIQGLKKAPFELRLFTTKTASHLGIKKKIGVWLSEHVDVPSVTGFIRPVILLPATILNHLSVQQTEAIILHELAHIRRNDYLVNLLQSVVELVLFFNPFAILLSKAAKKERENCCDDWVMNFQYDHYEYAKALLVLEEQRYLLQFRFALAATNSKKNLLHRVKRLFNTEPKTNFNLFQRIKLIGLCLLLIAGTLTLLPSMIKNPARGKIKTVISNKNEKLNLYKLNKFPKEITAKNIFISPPIKYAREKEANATNVNTKKQPVFTPSLDYVNAFINEDLLKPALEAAPLVSQVVEKDIANSKFIIKIEEQQSGKKQTNTYYFELNNKDGNHALKPLIMLHRIRAAVKKVISVPLTDSLNYLIKPGTRKRITT